VEVHASGASAVVVQRVPVAESDWFMEWQRGVTAVAERFAGYRATDVYPPGDPHEDHWVIVIHFVDEKSLQKWLAAPERSEWVEKLRGQAAKFDVQMMPGGFGAWFTGTRHESQAGPPGWKMVASVVLALFPTVMLISIIAGSYLARLGFAFSMLVGNFLSVAILQWVLMPPLTRLLRPWLNADMDRQWALSVGGLGAILLILAAMGVLFSLRVG
jgi:uncharacterized protein